MLLFVYLSVADRITGPRKPVDNRFGIYLAWVEVDLDLVIRWAGPDLLYARQLAQHLVDYDGVVIAI